MEIIGKPKLIKLKKKNLGNVKLANAIDKLITDIESEKWNDQNDIYKFRPDADKIKDGFFFFDLSAHRTLILIEIKNLAQIVWCGNHDEYEATFKNNKDTVRKWLKSNNWL